MTTPAAVLAGYGRQQQALQASVLRSLHRIWPMVERGQLAEVWEPFVEAVAQITGTGREQAVHLAAGFLRDYKAASGGHDAAVAVLAAAVADRRQLAVSLRATVLTTLAADNRAHAAAYVRAAGTVTRHVRNASRQTIVQSVEADPGAAGWARVPKPGACHFCALLATRGAVYKSRASAGDPAIHAYHDHCSCEPVPVYHGQTYHPAPYIRRWQDIYEQSTAGHSGAAARNAFRQALETSRAA